MKCIFPPFFALVFSILAHYDCLAGCHGNYVSTQIQTMSAYTCENCQQQQQHTLRHKSRMRLMLVIFGANSLVTFSFSMPASRFHRFSHSTNVSTSPPEMAHANAWGLWLANGEMEIRVEDGCDTDMFTRVFACGSISIPRYIDDDLESKNREVFSSISQHTNAMTNDDCTIYYHRSSALSSSACSLFTFGLCGNTNMFSQHQHAIALYFSDFICVSSFEEKRKICSVCPSLVLQDAWIVETCYLRQTHVFNTRIAEALSY